MQQLEDIKRDMADKLDLAEFNREIAEIKRDIHEIKTYINMPAAVSFSGHCLDDSYTTEASQADGSLRAPPTYDVGDTPSSSSHRRGATVTGP
jgi:hypothetical protein